MSDKGHVEYLGHVKYFAAMEHVLSDIEEECSGDLATLRVACLVRGSSRETFLTSSPIPPGIKESKSSMESDIFIVNPIKLTSAGTDFNAGTKQIVDQSPCRVTDGGSEIQAADQKATKKLCSSEEMNTSINSDTFVITPMKLTFNSSESTVNFDTENILDQAQLKDKDGGSTIQSVRQDANKNLQKHSSSKGAKKTYSNTDSGIFNIAPMRLTFDDSDFHSETENLVHQPQFLTSDGVSTIEPVHQNVTIRRRRHHRKPRRSTIEPVYQNIAAFKSIEAVGDQPFDGVSMIEPLHQNITVRRKHKKSRHHKRRRSTLASKPGNHQPVHLSINVSSSVEGSRLPHLGRWQIGPNQKYDQTNAINCTSDLADDGDQEQQAMRVPLPTSDKKPWKKFKLFGITFKNPFKKNSNKNRQ